VAKALGMYCFSDRYRQGVGSYKEKKKPFSFFRFVENGGWNLITRCFPSFQYKSLFLKYFSFITMFKPQSICA
jgi:hypothetical protein